MGGLRLAPQRRLKQCLSKIRRNRRQSGRNRGNNLFIWIWGWVRERISGCQWCHFTKIRNTWAILLELEVVLKGHLVWCPWNFRWGNWGTIKGRLKEELRFIQAHSDCFPCFIRSIVIWLLKESLKNGTKGMMCFTWEFYTWNTKAFLSL